MSFALVPGDAPSWIINSVDGVIVQSQSGRVRKIWWRHEYQDGVGNLSRIHSLIWLEDQSMDAAWTDTMLFAELICEDEVDSLIEEGLFDLFVMLMTSVNTVREFCVTPVAQMQDPDYTNLCLPQPT